MGRDSFDIKTITVIVLTVLVLIIISQNTQVISFQFLFWRLSLSRIVLLILMAVIFFLGFLLGQQSRRR